MIELLKERMLRPVARRIARFYPRFNRGFFIPRLIDPASAAARTPIRFGRHSVGDPDGLLNRPAEPSSRKWGGREPRFINYDASLVDALASDFKFSEGRPALETLHDVVYMPRHQCLYTIRGERVDGSCLYRGQMMAIPAPERVEPFGNLAVFEPTLVYVGGFISHFGHFLTEGIARFWYAVMDQEHPILAHYYERLSPRSVFLDRFFGAVDFPRERLVSFERPVLLKEVIVPAPSLTLMHEAFDVHRLIPEAVAERLLAATPGPVRRTAQPLYLSRSRLPSDRRHILKERTLELTLRRKKFKIVYPERLSLDEQIRLVNTHEVIVGPHGSALHGALFYTSPERFRNLVCFSMKGLLPIDFILIDAIKSVKSTYIAALEDPVCEPALGKARVHENRELDLDVTLGGLKQIGLL